MNMQRAIASREYREKKRESNFGVIVKHVRDNSNQYIKVQTYLKVILSDSKHNFNNILSTCIHFAFMQDISQPFKDCWQKNMTRKKIVNNKLNNSGLNLSLI